MADWGAVGASAVPLTGGYGGETFAVTAAGEDAVLRLHLRSPQRARIDVALTELVRGLLPVPRVLDAKPDGTADDPPYVLSERLPGVSLESFLRTADTAQRRRVGEQLGDLLATLSGIPFLRAGTFRDGDLTVPARRPAGWLGRHPVALTPEQITSLYDVLDAADALAAETDPSRRVTTSSGPPWSRAGTGPRRAPTCAAHRGVRDDNGDPPLTELATHDGARPRRADVPAG